MNCRTLRHSSPNSRLPRLGGGARAPMAIAVAVIAVLLTANPGSAAELSERQWEIVPYRVRVVLALATTGATGAGDEAETARLLGQRLEASLAPVWQVTVDAAATPAERTACFEASQLTDRPADELLGGADKLVLLAATGEPTGCVLGAREYDGSVRRWSTARERHSAQSSFLVENICQLAAEAMSPLARVEVSPDDPTHVRLKLRGSGLARPAGEGAIVADGRPFLPLVVRLDPRGRRVDQPAAPLPWTYFVVQGMKDDNVTAAVVSGMRNPFGARRRGMTELLAIALPATPTPVPIRLHARRDVKQPLAGFEVFRTRGDKEEPELLGRTGLDGTLIVPAAESPVSTLLVRSDGQLLAKAPVAAGVAPTLEIPLADDMVRVRAQASVRAIREELVDLVARRAILMARIKGALKRGKRDDAKRLMDELANLPIAATFTREIDDAESRAGASPDPAVDAAIRKQFADVRVLLGKFLDSRPITDLQYQVNSAGEEPAADAPDAPDAKPAEPADAQAAS